MRESNPIFQVVSVWFRRNFSDPEAIALLLTVVVSVVLIETIGRYLLPAFISIVIAYLLISLVRFFERCRLPHLLSVFIVYFLFLGLYAFALFGLLPLMWKQLASLVHELPTAFSKSQLWINNLVHHYPKLFSSSSLQHASLFLKAESAKIGQFILSYSLSSIPGIIELILYLVLVPLLVFFFLKDGKSIAAWFAQYLPRRRGLIQRVWTDVNKKISVYVRARVVEVLIVSIVSVIAFEILGLQYAVLLGFLLGVSTVVPYIGAIVVTLPVIIIGLMQWGLSAHFVYLAITYGLIITLDANLLVPILFSETMDLHPLVIILSVLVFGGLWGFWGVFLSIPLATLFATILSAWPSSLPPAEEGVLQEDAVSSEVKKET